MRTILAAVVLALLPQEKNEAEELFKKMEAKLAAAKSVQFKFEGEMNPRGVKLSGTLVFGETNQSRCDLEGKFGEESQSISVISDGKMARMTTSEPPENKAFAVPETLGRLMRLAAARAGCLGTIDVSQREEKAKEDPEKAFAASDFKLGAKEKVGEREAQAVEYKLVRKGEKDSAATVWIDAETHLPLKRTLKMGTKTLEENYSGWKLDEKIDAAKFELPE